MTKIISFPHIGDYAYLVKPFLENVTNLEVKIAPPITKKTLSLGSKYSPDFVCLPFKYNLGNYLEILEANKDNEVILFQFGGGCRYGNYAPLQQIILKDLDYNFKFYEFIKNGKTSFNYIYKIFKNLNQNLTRSKLLKELILIFLKIIIFDRSETYTRKKIEKNKGDFKKLKYKFLNVLAPEKNIFKIFKITIQYKRKRKSIKTKKPKLKIGIIGELFTSIEPFSTFNLEEELKNYDISIKRFTDVSYLLLYKKIFFFLTRFKCRNYLKYHLGADATSNIYRTLYLKKKHYDGIIHTKPFGCTPEVGIMPILSKIASDKNIPIMFLSFDTQESNTGIKTRIEAFNDMLIMRKEQKK